MTIESRSDNGIEVHDLVRVYKDGPRAVDGISLGSSRARSTASSAPTAPASRRPSTS